MIQNNKVFSEMTQISVQGKNKKEKNEVETGYTYLLICIIGRLKRKQQLIYLC